MEKFKELKVIGRHWDTDMYSRRRDRSRTPELISGLEYLELAHLLSVGVVKEAMLGKTTHNTTKHL